MTCHPDKNPDNPKAGEWSRERVLSFFFLGSPRLPQTPLQKPIQTIMLIVSSGSPRHSACSLARVVSGNNAPQPLPVLYPNRGLVKTHQDHQQRCSSLPLRPTSMSAIRQPGNLRVAFNWCRGWTSSTFLYSKVSAVAGCFRHFLITLGRRGTAAKISGVGVGFFREGVMLKRGVHFPEMEKTRFGRLEHVKTRMDGFRCTRDEGGPSAPQGEGCAPARVTGSLWL